MGPNAKVIGIAVAAALAFGAATSATAHTITIGYENAGVGSVNFWYGSYHTTGESPPNEGSLNLVGVAPNPFLPVTVPFDMQVGVMPAGLIDDVTNFGAVTYCPPGPGNTAACTADVNAWQGVNFSGLSPGIYQFTYIPIAAPSAKWAPWDESILTGTVTLSGQVVGCGAPGLPPCNGGTAPEPGTLGLLAAGLLGLGLSARRRKTR